MDGGRVTGHADRRDDARGFESRRSRARRRRPGRRAGAEKTGESRRGPGGQRTIGQRTRPSAICSLISRCTVASPELFCVRPRVLSRFGCLSCKQCERPSNGAPVECMKKRPGVPRDPRRKTQSNGARRAISAAHLGRRRPAAPAEPLVCRNESGAVKSGGPLISRMHCIMHERSGGRLARETSSFPSCKYGCLAVASQSRFPASLVLCFRAPTGRIACPTLN